eukprot:3741328-Amphidinium_carterae.2
MQWIERAFVAEVWMAKFQVPNQTSWLCCIPQFLHSLIYYCATQDQCLVTEVIRNHSLAHSLRHGSIVLEPPETPPKIEYPKIGETKSRAQIHAILCAVCEAELLAELSAKAQIDRAQERQQETPCLRSKDNLICFASTAVVTQHGVAAILSTSPPFTGTRNQLEWSVVRAWPPGASTAGTCSPGHDEQCRERQRG